MPRPPAEAFMGDEGKRPDQGGAGGSGGGRKGLPRWKVALLWGSVMVMVAAGVAWAIGAAGSSPPASGDTGETGKLVRGFAEQSGVKDAAKSTDPEVRNALEAWSPAVFRLGFGFFVGFCIAYALRAFFKISLIALGVVFLALFGLQYAGVLDVNWDKIERAYDASAEWVQSEAKTFVAFMQGYIPSIGAGLVGGFIGFRKG